MSQPETPAPAARWLPAGHPFCLPAQHVPEQARKEH